jgi:putative SOS response-associated peptidase YedK
MPSVGMPFYPKIYVARTVELDRLTQPARNLEPRYKVAPTSTIDAVRVRDGALELVPMRWGLVPSWWKKPLKDVPASFNARGETVADKPMFRSAFKRTRCIIPASGYYEWRTINGVKQPNYFSASDAGVLSIAGLWDEWNDITSGEPLLSCTMIVTEANEFAGRVHDRMPVFLAGDSFETWLDGEDVIWRSFGGALSYGSSTGRTVAVEVYRAMAAAGTRSAPRKA